VPADTLDIAALADLFNRGYSGYFTPVSLTGEAFAAMQAAHDVDLSRSSVVRLEGVPAGIVLLARRGRRGWIGGMGVTPEARGRGLGRELMRVALASAWESHLTSVQLEVIEENRWAIGIYEDVGFRDRRGLDVWVRPADAAPPPAVEPVAGPVDPARWLSTLDRRVASPRPWQRETVMLERANDLQVFAALDGGVPIAGIALRETGGRIAILDVASAAGAPAEALEASLAAAIAVHVDATMSLLNLDARDPARAALERFGFEVRFRQREMLRRRR
jgi:GNAT superfamily N-acetyltransferase